MKRYLRDFVNVKALIITGTFIVWTQWEGNLRSIVQIRPKAYFLFKIPGKQCAHQDRVIFLFLFFNFHISV